MKSNRLTFPAWSPLRWRPDARFAVRALTLLGLVALGWASAHLIATVIGWRSAEPALALPAPPAEDGAASRRALARWFAADASGPAEAAPLSNLQLVAVIAGRNGVALIGGIEATPVAVQTGTLARSDLRLVEVLPDRAVFDQNGTRMELAFPAPGDANLFNAPSSAPAAQAAGTAPAPAAAPEAAQPVATSEASVSRGRLTTMAQSANLGAWDKGLANFASGGIQITSAAEQPLAGVLELRDGDIIRQVNNREIRQLADISLVYHHFSQAQDVSMQILRDGKPMQINFKITP
ncbi:MAG: PDZ domain-containing protein [Candidatus Dactylopiibacterium sp.]|nr:PDZ domain-containing protein [Candidatus Dactylopiibacterium sp.]